ncbi:NBS-LRR disease resistance protein [Medicago truncatula]|uniref:NBS-LRR disease resistance protein n=1 Tax=Medicago truncatula TaxID=3880 RepID=G7JVR4_MEDTR|nr:NBS-LRR disease resistance protein [Medicago truncatula]
MVQKIKELSKRIEDLNANKRSFNFTNRTPEQRVLKQRETHSFILEEEVIGRDEEKKELIELLFNTGNDDLERRALAQLLYGDKEVKQHFELKKWVCVSDDFDVKDIAAKIIEQEPP